MEVHGRIDSEHLAFAAKFLGDSLVFFTQEGVAVAPRTIWYPLPEPPGRFAESALSRMVGALSSASAVVVIGYSFGIQRGGSAADSRSFEVFQDTLTSTAAPILIVDPLGEDLVVKLKELLKRENVLGFSVEWYRMARAMVSILRAAGSDSILGCIGNEEQILRLYGKS